MRRLAIALLVGGCSASAPTPESLAAGGRAGEVVTVEGVVSTLTFDNVMRSADEYDLQPGRWVLIRSSKPAGVTLGDLDPNALDRAWTLGLHLNDDQLAQRRFRLPQLGDRVRASGTFQRGAWAGNQLPMLDQLTALDVIAGQAPLADVGQACVLDGDCREELVCDRGARTCQPTPTPITWGSAWHDVNGACDRDDDCPIGQRCESEHTIPSAGAFAPEHLVTDAGRHVCVPLAGMSEAQLCPHPTTTADLAGGRWTQGREVCVRATIFVNAAADDGDSHVQLTVDEPLPYPAATARYEAFGAVSENGPPYKDPTRPGGGLPDPKVGQDVTVLGTYRYDDGHGWWEIHPVKMYWVH